MLKDNWSYLPMDILHIVFYYLERKEVSGVHIKHIRIPSQNLLQCQLTCKNWSSIAQTKFYNCIVLKGPTQLDLLIDSCSYTKRLIHHIKLDEREYIWGDTLITSFRKIALCFTEIKSIYANFHFTNEIWQVIQSEQSKGRFSKLQMIPFIPYPQLYQIFQYTDMAWSLQNTLRELVVYDIVPEPSENTERLSHFTNVDAVYFKLISFNNIYTIDKQLKKMVFASSVNVSCIEYLDHIYYKHVPVPVCFSSSFDALPQVKQLDVRKFLYNSDLYLYVMLVFQNLDGISLCERSISASKRVKPLSTEVAIRFLRYLLRISYINVNFIPFENVDRVLMEFYDPKRKIEELHIKYFQENQSIISTSYLSVWNSINGKMYMEISCGKESSKAILPRIGMIGKNGYNFQCIHMDMGFGLDSIELLVHQEDSDSLSWILNQCPNLKNISIARTILRKFGTALQEKKIPFFQEVELSDVLVYDSFLRDMSLHLPFIEEFRITYCRFDSETAYNINLHMPNTRFATIAYYNTIDIKKFYLKLLTVDDNKTYWFVGDENYYTVCTEIEYQNSLQSENIFSFFFQCKQVDTIWFTMKEINLFIDINFK